MTEELLKFNVSEYLEKGKVALSLKENAEDVADKIVSEGFKNIYLMGMGGTEFELYHFQYILNKYFDIKVKLVNAADFLLIKDEELNAESIVVTASSSGNTVEIINATRILVEKNIRVVAFTSKNSELGELATFVIDQAAITGEVEFSYATQSLFFYKLLNLLGQFDEYEKFSYELESIFENLVQIRKNFEKKADIWASNLYKAEHTIFTASGALWGECLLYSMCLLEEMQWIRTRPVSSSQFFHGTLELVEPGVPVFIIKGEDEFREQDNRVESFCRKINAEHYVFDTKEFALNNISDEFRKFLVPWIATALLTDRMSKHYENYTKHNLSYRRYYRQFQY